MLHGNNLGTIIIIKASSLNCLFVHAQNYPVNVQAGAVLILASRHVLLRSKSNRVL